MNIVCQLCRSVVEFPYDKALLLSRENPCIEYGQVEINASLDDKNAEDMIDDYRKKICSKYQSNARRRSTILHQLYCKSIYIQSKNLSCHEKQSEHQLKELLRLLLSDEKTLFLYSDNQLRRYYRRQTVNSPLNHSSFELCEKMHLAEDICQTCHKYICQVEDGDSSKDDKSQEDEAQKVEDIYDFTHLKNFDRSMNEAIYELAEECIAILLQERSIHCSNLDKRLFSYGLDYKSYQPKSGYIAENDSSNCGEVYQPAREITEDECQSICKSLAKLIGCTEVKMSREMCNIFIVYALPQQILEQNHEGELRHYLPFSIYCMVVSGKKSLIKGIDVQYQSPKGLYHYIKNERRERLPLLTMVTELCGVYHLSQDECETTLNAFFEFHPIEIDSPQMLAFWKDFYRKQQWDCKRLPRIDRQLFLAERLSRCLPSHIELLFKWSLYSKEEFKQYLHQHKEKIAQLITVEKENVELTYRRLWKRPDIYLRQSEQLIGILKSVYENELLEFPKPDWLENNYRLQANLMYFNKLILEYSLQLMQRQKALYQLIDAVDSAYKLKLKKALTETWQLEQLLSC